MPTSGVARRYARAVFEIAKEENDLDGWLRDLRAIRDQLQDPELEAFLTSPGVSTEAKQSRCDTLLSSSREKARNLVSVLILNHRTGLTPSIVVSYEEELDRLRGIVHARVTTAITLNETEAAKVGHRLEDITGRQVVVSTAVDPSILGGFVARIGDQLIDASVVGRLQALRASLTA